MPPSLTLMSTKFSALLDGSRPMTAPLNATQGVQLGSSQQASIVYNETTRAIEFIIN